jgi:hypothetical protein
MEIALFFATFNGISCLICFCRSLALWNCSVDLDARPRHIMKAYEVDVLPFTMLRNFEQIQDPEKPRLTCQLWRDVGKPDRSDRIHLDFPFFHAISDAHPYGARRCLDRGCLSGREHGLCAPAPFTSTPVEQISGRGNLLRSCGPVRPSHPNGDLV